ncbi:CD8A protein, partial [Spelaeornis formosus]|nr:CD8A protein [Elachura formosa]
MDTSPALLLLIALGFCEYRHGQGGARKTHGIQDIGQLRVGQDLELECWTGKSSGAFWIHQDKSGTLHFIVFISSMSQATFNWRQKTPTHLKAWKHDKFYYLVVKQFTLYDEGKYFCMMNFNQQMYFSPGQPVFLSDITTAAPPSPTTRGPTPSRGRTEEPNPKTPDPAERRMRNDLNFFCHVFIWIPLAGACLLLLIALVITTVLCKQTTRRRCRCKR